MTNPKAVSAPEPVAWRWKQATRTDEAAWSYTRVHPDLNDSHVVEPLYDPAALASLVAERDALEADAAEYETMLAAMKEKLDALAPHGTCGCSYDQPGDLCDHHSPRVKAVTAERDALREAHAAFGYCLVRLELFLSTFGDLGGVVTQADMNDWQVAWDRAARTLSVEPK